MACEAAFPSPPVTNSSAVGACRNTSCPHGCSRTYARACSTDFGMSATSWLNWTTANDPTQYAPTASAAAKANMSRPNDHRGPSFVRRSSASLALRRRTASRIAAKNRKKMSDALTNTAPAAAVRVTMPTTTSTRWVNSARGVSVRPNAGASVAAVWSARPSFTSHLVSGC